MFSLSLIFSFIPFQSYHFIFAKLCTNLSFDYNLLITKIRNKRNRQLMMQLPQWQNYKRTQIIKIEIQFVQKTMFNFVIFFSFVYIFTVSRPFRKLINMNEMSRKQNTNKTLCKCILMITRKMLKNNNEQHVAGNISKKFSSIK